MVIKMISTIFNNSPNKIHLYKVKSNVGIAGNECADAIAKHQANLKDQQVARASSTHW